MQLALLCTSVVAHPLSQTNAGAACLMLAGNSSFSMDGLDKHRPHNAADTVCLRKLQSHWLSAQLGRPCGFMLHIFWASLP
jgi:hypothetical protein